MMMLFGAAVGGMGGWAYGGTLMPSDIDAFRTNTQQAMVSASDGQVVNWVNPETRVAGSITPTGSFVGKKGLQCRRFEATVAAKEGVGRGNGAACKGLDGQWLVYGLSDDNV
jgi:surface antigen